MARGLRFTKPERDFLKSALGSAVDWAAFGAKEAKAAASILAKVEASESAPTTVDAAPLEAALIAGARGKVIALEGGWPRARVQATAVKATVEDARMVGEWMARQGWLLGPMTLLDVLNKWHFWLPKARATQPPPRLEEGLGKQGVSEGVVPEKQGKAAGKNRAVPGFR